MSPISTYFIKRVPLSTLYKCLLRENGISLLNYFKIQNLAVSLLLIILHPDILDQDKIVCVDV